MGFLQEAKQLFKKKDSTEKGLSYRGTSLWYWDSIKTGTELYYRLYRKNTDLRRCIEELYQTVWKDGYVIKRGETILEKTNYHEQLESNQEFFVLKSLIIRDLSIAGNVYILKLPNALWTVAGFQVLDPRTIRVVANKHGEIIGYIQTVGWDSQSYTPDELLHYRDMIDHDNEVFGISKVETLVYDILGDEESGKSNFSYFKNNAIPSSIIVLDNELNEDETKLALEQLQKNFSWGENKHRISASTGIKDIKVLGNTMKDMEFTVLRRFTTERICSAMWVPKTILGYSDNVNFSTSDNQYRKFIQNTINPLSRQLEIIFTDLVQCLDSSLTVELIDNTDYAIDEKITRYEKLVSIGAMTINEVRGELGKEIYNDTNANKGIIRQGFELIEDIWVNEVQNIEN